MKPGIYVNRCSARLLLSDGSEIWEASDRCNLVDTEEQKNRETAFRGLFREDPDSCHKKEFVGELPWTPLWEGDFVQVQRSGDEILQVVGIDYHHLGTKTNIGTNWPVYQIAENFGAGSHSSYSEKELTLVERGPVWKFYHNEPIKFPSIEEEAVFAKLIGQAKSLRNPANGLFKWTKEEAEEAVQSGFAHAITLTPGLFGGNPHPGVLRFTDEDLGRRVAEVTLVGYGLTPTPA